MRQYIFYVTQTPESLSWYKFYMIFIYFYNNLNQHHWKVGYIFFWLLFWKNILIPIFLIYRGLFSKCITLFFKALNLEMHKYISEVFILQRKGYSVGRSLIHLLLFYFNLYFLCRLKGRKNTSSLNPRLWMMKK